MDEGLFGHWKTRAMRLTTSWATRSLAVGALATLLDLAVGLFALHVLSWSTRMAAMSGVAIGAGWQFVGNRLFAFREKQPEWLLPALRFLCETSAAMLVHGQLVVWLCGGWGVLFAVAKLLSDFVVFTFGQLLLMRWVVFPKRKDASAQTSQG